MNIFWILMVLGILALVSKSQLVRNTGLSLPGIKGEFFNAYDAAQTYWQDLSTRIPSTTDKERYRWLGTVPTLREWGTGRLAKGLRSESYDIENLKYESTIEVDREEIEDDQLGHIRLRIAEMAVRAADYKDFLIEQLLINGESSGFNSYDGVTFFNATHEEGASGEQSNLLTYGATDADNPTRAEFQKAVGQAIAAMVAFKDDQGLPIRIKPTAGGLVCIVPPQMLITAMEALNISFVPDDETVLRSNVVRSAARVIALPGLTDASKWYLLKTDTPVRPFIFQDRMPLEFQALDEDSEEGFIRDKFLYGVRARFRMTYGYWQYAIRTDFT